MISPRPPKTKRPRDAGHLSLRLYVAGQMPDSLDAIANLRALCAGYDPARITIEIVDALQERERTLDDGIVVTPTLVRLFPEPVQLILGSLSNLERVRSALSLNGHNKNAHGGSLRLRGSDADTHFTP